MNIDHATYWITEREAIRKRREQGQGPPWTSDPVLRNFRFCNVRREHDAVTRHIATTWREPNAGDPNLWFAMTLARFINLPETLDELGYPVSWDRELFVSVLSSRMRRGDRVFGPAYVIPNGGSSKPKIDYLADNILNRLWRARDHMPPEQGVTLAAYCARLMHFDGIGSFMAAQVLADLKYVEPLRSAADWTSFAISGPGSRRGLNRVMNRPPDAPWIEPAWRRAFGRFEEAIRPELQRIGLGDLHCQDLQNCLCEIDKYLRCALGQSANSDRHSHYANYKRTSVLC
ncbi:nucleotide kinase domain-containing protein [Bradyrhizobium sp. LA7.1]|uniref:nucleotide kinase domain-containing protein n=1 Tax=Bradyrhizobium sp. LA7.1 TaxID=3156324 RepID=UPI00339A6610